MTTETEKADADVVSAISGEMDSLIRGEQLAHNASNSRCKEAIALGFETLEEDEHRELSKNTSAVILATQCPLKLHMFSAYTLDWDRTLGGGSR